MSSKISIQKGKLLKTKVLEIYAEYIASSKYLLLLVSYSGNLTGTGDT